MSDYISREAAIADFEKHNQEKPVWTPQRVKTLLMRIPTADVEPVRHGRWIIRKEHLYLADGVCKEWYNFFCSACDAPREGE